MLSRALLYLHLSRNLTPLLAAAIMIHGFKLSVVLYQLCPHHTTGLQVTHNRMCRRSILHFAFLMPVSDTIGLGTTFLNTGKSHCRA